MRRAAGVLAISVAVLAGCTSVSRVAESPHDAAWRRLCACFGPTISRPATGLGLGDYVPSRSVPYAIANQAAEAVVHVRTLVRDRPPATTAGTSAAQPVSRVSGGTGIMIGQGLILTARHVVDGATSVSVVFSDGSCCPVERVLSDANYDLAVLRTSYGKGPSLSLTPAAPVEGSPVMAIGRPSPAEPAAECAGILTNSAASLQLQLDPSRRLKYDRLIESTVRLEPGFSGGPLLDSHGRLLGVNVALVKVAPDHVQRGYSLPLVGEVREAIIRLLRRAARAGHDSPRALEFASSMAR